ncbi:hypothetical protein DFR70_1337 [Nocardia tenerifensis]|uniref:Uncharacterized protein n=1 Tax=Nocardia tenerifensis TaxID=228006 RepID=A0A318JQC6_9NOCA|nr:hypothetical protein DFR70_1337 [Nocardia tenerifensis]
MWVWEEEKNQDQREVRVGGWWGVEKKKDKRLWLR